MSPIHSSPSEILVEIFAELDTLDITDTSHWWREAILRASNLWLNIEIMDYDTNHAEVVLDHLRRSQQRPISLVVKFFPRPPTSSSGIRTFLEAVIQPNLVRCRSLTVHAMELGHDFGGVQPGNLSHFAQSGYCAGALADNRIQSGRRDHFATTAEPPNRRAFDTWYECGKPGPAKHACTASWWPTVRPGLSRWLHKPMAPRRPADPGTA
ncbi:hypothetical protein C8R43DRAFT_633589 [Mycena crocata]|nr:hypothetical protein C8R43DRAFT_633589 [Mycena crocata]